MKTIAAVLFSSLAISALIFAISSGNHLRIWLRYDGKIHLRVKLYLLDNLLLYDFMISGGKTVRMSRKDRRLLSFVFSKNVNGHKEETFLSPKVADILDVLEKSKVQWSLRMELGTDDAAQTALLCGTLMSLLKALALSSLSWAPSQVQKISLLPAMRPCANINFSCMFSIKTGHIIIVAAKIALRKARAKMPRNAQKSQKA